MSNKPQHSYQGNPLQFMAQRLLKCNDATPNPDLGKVDAWVKQGKCYWASNIQLSGQYEGDVVFDLFDNEKNHIKPNETYQKWKGSRFTPLTGMVCSN
jgi:hypothetical protein